MLQEEKYFPLEKKFQSGYLKAYHYHGINNLKKVYNSWSGVKSTTNFFLIPQDELWAILKNESFMMVIECFICFLPSLLFYSKQMSPFSTWKKTNRKHWKFKKIIKNIIVNNNKKVLFERSVLSMNKKIVWIFSLSLPNICNYYDW